jgi:hypothetical protein
MKTIREANFGNSIVRLLEMKDGYAGIIIHNSKRLGPYYDTDPDRLWQSLARERAKVHPDYFGYSGAKSRLLHVFPEGLAGQTYVDWERRYKLDAKAYLDLHLPLEQAHNAVADNCRSALRTFQKTNLLSQFEKARIAELLRGIRGSDFIKAAAEFADGAIKSGLFTMERLLREHGQPSWPVATYLAFLWRPHEHMFLKPKTTVDFARRVGNGFADSYSSEFRAEVYASLLGLAEETELEISDLAPRDRIDVQGFIWIVGNYTEADVEKARAAQAGGTPHRLTRGFLGSQ